MKTSLKYKKKLLYEKKREVRNAKICACPKWKKKIKFRPCVNAQWLGKSIIFRGLKIWIRTGTNAPEIQIFSIFIISWDSKNIHQTLMMSFDCPQVPGVMIPSTNVWGKHGTSCRKKCKWSYHLIMCVPGCTLKKKNKDTYEYMVSICTIYKKNVFLKSFSILFISSNEDSLCTVEINYDQCIRFLYLYCQSLLLQQWVIFLWFKEEK